jgi:hypothetical protein
MKPQLLLTRKVVLRLRSGLLLLAPIVSSAHGRINNLRMSVKIIVDPNAGAWPGGIVPQTFTNAVTAANKWMASYWRGYRFQLAEATNIRRPTEGGVTGPSKWFRVVFRFDSLRADFFSTAQNDCRYLLSSDLINIYVATPVSAPGNSGGAMPILPQPPWS